MNTLILCLIIAILMPYIMKLIVAYYMNQQGRYDNNHPRIQQSQLQGIGARALAAHQNGFEALIVFSTAVLVAIGTNHIGTTIQTIAIIYILSRVIYNILYLKNLASLRSLCWFAGIICCLSILILCML